MSSHAGHPADLCHPALVYASAEQFLAVTVPFLREGLQRGEQALAVTSSRNIGWLREALGDDAARVDFHPADTWLTTPWRALVAYRRWVERHTAGRDDARVRVIGEPFAPQRTPAAVREWTRYEGLLNVAFADMPLSILCPYDANALPAAIVADALRTHPQVLQSSQQLFASPDYADVRDLSAEIDRIAMEPSRAPVAERPLGDDLRGIRSFVAAQAQHAGVEDARITDVTLAAHEVAANACTHGGGRAVLRTWTDAREFLCEIVDRGAGMADPLAGNVEPEAEQPSGRGLWLARQLCDLVQVRTGADGTVVRLHVTLA